MMSNMQRMNALEGINKGTKSILKRPRKLQPEDRLFSLSSVTSPAYLTPFINASSAGRHCPQLMRAHGDMAYYRGIIVDWDNEPELQTAEELGVGRDDGRSDYGPGRSKGGALPSNGQGKPKKGRAALTPRDGKRNRPSSEPDFDDEDDPDMNLR
ncbi:hypothetical protein EZV62_000895 [Acer yangbiense]|uniref:Uncharacterized protein n=1 Tax=Acer yangbiense TaxID=1000413 RepID=A0A5C7IV14_9ROSI|nr:hypothetical protein EZV62_000895 [Acer yangbiense]